LENLSGKRSAIFNLIIFVLKGEENKMKDSRVNVANERIERKRTKRELEPFYKVKAKSSWNHIVYGLKK
jgi:hypothetical protein